MNRLEELEGADRLPRRPHRGDRPRLRGPARWRLEFTRAGHGVTGFDVDPERVALAARGRLLHRGRALRGGGRGRRAAASSPRPPTSAGSRVCDVINVCVPTPLTKAKDPDVSHMAAALERDPQAAARGPAHHPGQHHLSGHHARALRPDARVDRPALRRGFRARLRARAHRSRRTSASSVRDVPKVVGGETPLCTELAALVFQGVFDRIVPVSSTQAAEMVKLLENTFRAINIGLANEVALMCRPARARRLGGDRGRRDQALRLHEVPARARASAATASRSTRPTWPGR